MSNQGKITYRYLLIFLPWALCVFTVFPVVSTQAQRTKATKFRRAEPNLYAPNLYSDDLTLKLTLIDLPGAGDADSYWEVSYRVFFISEAQFQEVTEQMRKRLAPNGSPFSWNPNPTFFPKKILLAQGRFKTAKLTTPTERTYFQSKILFRSRIPDKARTKFATLMTSFSVKIYDARLKSTIYESSAWLTTPFEDDAAQPENAIPRTTLYANFFISSQGQLFKSQWTRNSDSTNWP